MDQHLSSTKRNKSINLGFYTQQKYFSKMKIFFRHTKFERIHDQQNYTIRNVERSHSGRKKMIPDGNMIPHKKPKITGNSNYLNKYVIDFLISKK